MNPRLKNFLIICGNILAFIAAIGAIVLFRILIEIFQDVLFEFLLAKTSSVILAAFGAFLGTLAALLATVILCCIIHVCCSIFTDKITNSYQSFKNENSDDNIFSEIYNDPTIVLKDKILFFLYI